MRLFSVLEYALADCEHVLLHFRGPVCDLSVQPVTAVTGRRHDLLAGQGVPLPPAVRAASDPYALLRFILAACPALAARAEAEICQQEILAAAAARPSPGIRTLLDGPASVSIIGDVCPAAIKGYLARLYARKMDRVRLVIGRLGADPARSSRPRSPSCRPPSCSGCHPRPAPWWPAPRTASAPPARPGAGAIGYARTAAATDQLTAARAAAITRRHDCIRRRLLHRTAPAVRPSPRTGPMTATTSARHRPTRPQTRPGGARSRESASSNERT